MGWRRVSVLVSCCLGMGLVTLEACRPGEPISAPARGKTPISVAKKAAAKPNPKRKTSKADDKIAAQLAPKLDAKQACALPAGRIGRALDGAAAFTRADPVCPKEENFCDNVETPPASADSCFVANSNIRRAERESGSAKAASAVSSAEWDKKTAPENFDRIDAHLHLSDGEKRRLSEQGFVVLDRLPEYSYAGAYHDIFQQELPVFISVDSVMHAIFRANDAMLMNIEMHRLAPKLSRMIDKLRAELKNSTGLYDPESIADLGVYLGVAHALLHAQPGDEKSAELVGYATQDPALREVSLFGRERMIDFSQLEPRGHYALPTWGDPMNAGKETLGLDAYFRAMMWLSRLEFNLVSRDSRSSAPGELPDPSETPREARSALALADLVSRAGALADLRDFETTYTLFAGKREDVAIGELLALMKRARISPKTPDAPEKLVSSIGDGFRRTARIHYMPQGVSRLPVITTLFGPRIVPDIAPLTGLVHDAIPDRLSLDAGDVGFALGHDRAKNYVKGINEFPGLPDALSKARSSLRETADKRSDLYARWLSAVLHLADRPDGVLPAFMRSPAYEDFRLNSALVGYGQIRHTYVLLAGQGYDAYGCEIPDGFVEPAVTTYKALVDYTRAAAALDPKRKSYFRRVEKVLSMLVGISEAELRGEPLSEPQKRWLGMVSEFIPQGGFSDSGAPPKYTGWYFDLFPDREIGASKSADFVADYFTLTNLDKVRYLGVEGLRLGVFVVDTGGAARAMVGPVAKGYQAETAIANRLTDAAARSAEKSASWLGYLAPAPEEPPLDVDFFECERGERRIVVKSPRELGEVTLTLLDHHGDPVTQSVTKPVGPENTVFAFVPAEQSDEGLHLHVATGPIDIVYGVSVYPAAYDDGEFSKFSARRYEASETPPQAPFGF